MAMEQDSLWGLSNMFLPTENAITLEVSARGTGKSTRLIKSVLLRVAQVLTAPSDNKVYKLCIVTPNRAMGVHLREMLVNSIESPDINIEGIIKDYIDFIDGDSLRSYLIGIHSDKVVDFVLDEFDFLNEPEDGYNDYFLENIYHACTTPKREEAWQRFKLIMMVNLIYLFIL